MKKFKLATTLLLAGLSLSSISCSSTGSCSKATSCSTNSATGTASITKAEVLAAQQAWCDALVAIGKAHTEGKDAKALANKVLSEAYDYDQGQVFFKPTLTHGKQTFRPTKEGALAYFVGGDPKFPDDKGFALTPWVKARFDNQGPGAEDGIQIHGNVAITMGNVWVAKKDGTEVMVDKTFVFRKGSDGKLRLVVHHSSLPYSPK